MRCMRWLTPNNNYAHLAALTISVGSSPLIASSLADAVQACAQEPDSLRRLVCYDQVAGRSATGATPAVTPNVAPMPVAAASPTAPAAKAPPAASRREDVTATVTHVKRRADGRYVVTLDNGDVWSEVETKERFNVNEGDTVTVRTELLGTHYLHTDAGADVRVVRQP